jgi:hypothetical protein
MNEERISEEEFRKKLNIIHMLINELNIKLDIDGALEREMAEEIGFAETFAIEQRLYEIKSELKKLKLKYISKIIKAVFPSAIILYDLSSDELNKLKNEIGFNDWQSDNECVQMALFKLADSIALLFICTLYDGDISLSYGIKQQK